MSSATELRPLTMGELRVLDLLREDRDNHGDGVHSWDVARIDGTLYPGRTIARLHAHGYVIGEQHGVYHLGFEEPPATPTGASDDAAAPLLPGRSSDAPVDAAPRLFDLPSQREAA